MTEQLPQILDFPFPQRTAEECKDVREHVFQLKLEAAHLLNEVAEGYYILSPENIRGIQNLNDWCCKVGLSPLDFEAPN